MQRNRTLADPSECCSSARALCNRQGPSSLRCEHGIRAILLWQG